jgi:hypothetical protein
MLPPEPSVKMWQICEDEGRWCLPSIGEPPRMTIGGTGRITKRINKGWVGGKILTFHGYRDEREDQYRLFPSLILFRLVAPPLQSGVVGPYVVWGTWFPNHLPPEGAGHIQIFWAVTGNSRYPRVQDPIMSKAIQHEETQHLPHSLTPCKHH